MQLGPGADLVASADFSAEGQARIWKNVKNNQETCWFQCLSKTKTLYYGDFNIFWTYFSRNIGPSWLVLAQKSILEKPHGTIIMNLTHFRRNLRGASIDPWDRSYVAIPGRCFNGAMPCGWDELIWTYAVFVVWKEIIILKRWGYELWSKDRKLFVAKNLHFFPHGFHFHGSIGIYLLYGLRLEKRNSNWIIQVGVCTVAVKCVPCTGALQFASGRTLLRSLGRCGQKPIPTQGANIWVRCRMLILTHILPIRNGYLPNQVDL